MTDKVRVRVDNIKPYNSFSFLTTIPSNTAIYNQSFPYSVNLKSDDYNYVSRVVVRVDTAGIWNVPVPETVEINSIPFNVNPGNYTISELESLFGVTIPIDGAFAFLAINTDTLQFSPGSNVQQILGYQSFGTNLIPVGTQATQAINQSGGLDFLSISSTLIQTGTGFGSNFLTAFPVTPQTLGVSVASIERMEVPILNNQFQSIQWFLTNASGLPYNINTPILIFTEISCIKKF